MGKPKKFKHAFETPYSTESGATKCNEFEDVVEFDTTDNMKVGICTPKAPSNGKCPADDHPKRYKGIPQSIPDANGSHCQLPCSNDDECAGKSKCFAIYNGEKNICLYA